MNKLTCTYEELVHTAQVWHLSDFAMDIFGRRAGLRLGQYIWNKHGQSFDSWAELYYCEDPTKAFLLASSQFFPEIGCFLK